MLPFFSNGMGETQGRMGERRRFRKRKAKTCAHERNKRNIKTQGGIRLFQMSNKCSIVRREVDRGLML